LRSEAVALRRVVLLVVLRRLVLLALALGIGLSFGSVVFVPSTQSATGHDV
jgi:hypothetical protein